jgi:hypothetical protein
MVLMSERCSRKTRKTSKINSLRKRNKFWETLGNPAVWKNRVCHEDDRPVSTNHHRRRCVHRLTRNHLTPRASAFYVNPRKSVIIRGVADAMLNR